MALSALGSLADSIEATRDFLFSPLEPRRWLALALLVFFAGGLGGFNPMSFSSTPSTQTGQEPQPVSDAEVQDGIAELQDVVAENLVWIVAVVGALFVIGLLFRLVAAVFQFAFVESLRRESVDVLGYSGEHFGKGVRLLGFQIVVDLLAFLPVAALGYVLWDPIVSGEIVEANGVPWGTVVPLVAVAVLAGVLAAIVHGLTTSFVVPIMLVEDCGVLAGWRRFLSVFLGSIVEYVVYGILAFVLRLALGSVAAILGGIASLVVIVPLGLVGLAAWFGLGAGPAAATVLGLVALVGFVLVLAIFAIVQVPFASYLRYYSLLVLGDTEPDVDPVPGIRERIREDPMPGADEPA